MRLQVPDSIPVVCGRHPFASDRKPGYGCRPRVLHPARALRRATHQGPRRARSTRLVTPASRGYSCRKSRVCQLLMKRRPCNSSNLCAFEWACAGYLARRVDIQLHGASGRRPGTFPVRLNAKPHDPPRSTTHGDRISDDQARVLLPNRILNTGKHGQLFPSDRLLLPNERPSKCGSGTRSSYA